MTVQEVMKITGLPRGTVENFRRELLDFGVLQNNQSMDGRNLKALQQAMEYKEKNDYPWTRLMRRVISEEYKKELMPPFYWSTKIHVRHLLWMMKKGLVTVEKIDDSHPLESYIFYDIMVDNFVELANEIHHYKQSRHTDGNPLLSYKITGLDFVYYTVGKLNHDTGEEDLHLFYNEGLHFNIMRCQHIIGGSTDYGVLKALYEALMAETPDAIDLDPLY